MGGELLQEQKNPRDDLEKLVREIDFLPVDLLRKRYAAWEALRVLQAKVPSHSRG